MIKRTQNSVTKSIQIIFRNEIQILKAFWILATLVR